MAKADVWSPSAGPLSLSSSLPPSVSRPTCTSLQACGVAFGILAFDNVSVFVAYLVLGESGSLSRFPTFSKSLSSLPSSPPPPHPGGMVD